jgi:hypothetical protein
LALARRHVYDDLRGPTCKQASRNKDILPYQAAGVAL